MPFVILFFILFFVLVFVIAHYSAKNWQEKLQAIALQFPGMEVTQGSWLRGSQLRHSGSGWEATVSFYGGSKNSPPYTRVDLRYDRNLPAFKIGPQGFFSGIAKFFGAEDVEIGVADFDSRYIIKANPSQYAKAYLTPEVRATLDRIGQISGCTGFHFEFSGGIGRVSVPRYLRKPELLISYLQSAFLLAEGLAGAKQEPGIQITAQGNSGHGTCQVCGQALSANVVQCRKCQTPHHRDCWDYLGGCSTFRCGEKKHS